MTNPEQPFEPMPLSVDYFREIDPFCSCSDSELKELLPFFRTITLEPWQILFEEDDHASQLFVVASGELELEIQGVTVRRFSPAQVFGEIGLIDQQLRTGTVRALEPSQLFSLSAEALFGERSLPPAIALKIVRGLARKVTLYLRSYEHTTSQAIIHRGESDRVEFKSTLRWHLHAKRFDKVIENAVLKTLAAYLNTEGGILFIGVGDTGAVLGLDADKFPNMDKALLHLTSLIRDRLGSHHMRFLHPRVEQLEGKQIIRIDARASAAPAYLKEDQDEAFYVRTGPASTRLRTSQIFEYVLRRFPFTPASEAE